MKNLKTLAIILLTTLASVTSNSQTRKVETTKSKIGWVGKKVTGQHEGIVNLKEGTLIFKDNKLKGGTFTVDMTSLIVTDLKAGEGKEKLEGHLKSGDFFGTDKYSTSTLVFKTIAKKENNTYTITADLTIKDKTNPIVFDITVNGNTAVAMLSVDRTKFDIKYGSGSFFDNLGDKAISNEFDLNVSLVF